MTYRLAGFGGLILFMLAGYAFSENRKRIDGRLVAWGTLLQIIFALIILKTRAGYFVFDAARIGIGKLLAISDRGAEFLFGRLTTDPSFGAVMAFRVLPVIIFVSTLSGILYHLGVIQFVIRLIARVMQKTMKTSGAESLGAALFIFMGIEAVTAIRSYVERMTRSELFTIMTAFMATIASSVMATYVSFGASAGHLLAASVMSAPAAVVLAKLMIPETGIPETSGRLEFKKEKNEENIIEAAAGGASAGLKLALEIGAMLLAFIALIHMLDAVFGLFRTSFDTVTGYLFAPFAFLMGIPFKESLAVGRLLGTKTVFNEFLAYLKLQEMVHTGLLSPRSVVIATYALCGFANFGSIAILIGGISSLAPSRRSEAAALGLKALVSGTLASFMTAAIAGILL